MIKFKTELIFIPYFLEEQFYEQQTMKKVRFSLLLVLLIRWYTVPQHMGDQKLPKLVKDQSHVKY